METIPQELQEKIVLSVTRSSFLGPPVGLLPLLLLSKRLFNNISRENNPHLYALIFLDKFDVSAAVRRFGEDCGHANKRLGDELARRFTAMKRIKEDAYPRSVNVGMHQIELLRVDLWTVYLMFIESDVKNAAQLIHYAKIGTFANNFIELGGRLHDLTQRNGGWIMDNEVNALATWIFWFTDKDRVKCENLEQRQRIIQALIDVFVGGFKYHSSYQSIKTFRSPTTTLPPLPGPASAVALAALPLSLLCKVSGHFGFELNLACPLLTPAALMSCAVRLDEQNRMATRFVDWDDKSKGNSHKHEDDWARLNICHNLRNRPSKRGRTFTPGDLDGLWKGKWWGTTSNESETILSLDQAGQLDRALPYIYTVPMEFRLKEHYQKKSDAVVTAADIGYDGTGKGVLNAWFPEETTMMEREGNLQVSVPNTKELFSYKTYDHSLVAREAVDEEFSRTLDQDGPYGAGVWDIILTAQTDAEFGQEWGYREYYGRVRDWDGLIVLVRRAVGDDGQWIFRGYLHGKQNLVGRWRETGTPIDAPGLEGVWSMTKSETQ